MGYNNLISEVTTLITLLLAGQGPLYISKRIFEGWFWGIIFHVENLDWFKDFWDGFASKLGEFDTWRMTKVVARWFLRLSWANYSNLSRPDFGLARETITRWPWFRFFLHRSQGNPPCQLPYMKHSGTPIFGYAISLQNFLSLSLKSFTLRIQVCPKKGINPTILLWGWDWNHQSYSRKGSGFLGLDILTTFRPEIWRIYLRYRGGSMDHADYHKEGVFPCAIKFGGGLGGSSHLVGG